MTVGQTGGGGLPRSTAPTSASPSSASGREEGQSSVSAPKPRQSACTWAALEAYFNKNFQLYGRRLSFYCIEPTTQSVADEDIMALEVTPRAVITSPSSTMRSSITCSQ